MPRRVSKAPRATQAAELCRANPPATVTVAVLGPVDTLARPPHRAPVSKPRKVEEPQAPYAAKKPAKAAQAPAGPRFADLEKVRANNAKLIRVHSKVLQKLAQ
jgi:hypothetical protein